MTGIDLTKTPALSWLPLLSEQEADQLTDVLYNPIWQPINHPQIAAICSEADELYFGGAAGGGKTDLLLGIALTQHRRSMISRREAVNVDGLEDRLKEMCGSRLSYNGQKKVGTIDGRIIKLGSMKNADDWKKHQGKAYDFQGYDEAVHFIRSQVTMLRTWNRTIVEGQRTRRILASNPPTDPDGYWIMEMFAPWLDEHHHNPALPGELRWFAVFDGSEIEVPGPDPIEHRGRMVKPFSRTFIPARVEDNPILMATGYMDQLDSLPEPLRSMFRDGSFTAGHEDDVWQVIPTEWVKAAQARWTPDGDAGLPMDSMGVDVARGGKDKTVIGRRHRDWYAPLLAYPGSATPDGPSAAALVVSALRDSAPVHVDIIGPGGSVHDHLDGNGVHSVPVNGSAESLLTDRSGQLRFTNKRAELYWRFRESLDPQYGSRVKLPPDRELMADLCALKWRLTSRGIQTESKTGETSDGFGNLCLRLGRSPDKGDAVIYASATTMKRSAMQRMMADRSSGGGYDMMEH